MAVQIYSADNPPPARTTALEAWTESTVPVTDGSERQLGKDAFLTLLLTQLQNQDPFNPMQDTDMTAQLAQFSQLEQLTNLNTNVTSMTGYIQAQNQFQTLSLIGKEVRAQSNLLSVTGGEVDVSARLELSEACSIQIYVVDEKGNQVRMYDMGLMQAGDHAFNWDGRDTNGAKVPDGLYQFQVTATSIAGEIISDGIVPEITGRVSSVSFDEYGQPVVHLGYAQLSLTQVMEILQGSSQSADSGSSGSSSESSSTDTGDLADSSTDGDSDSSAEESLEEDA